MKKNHTANNPLIDGYLQLLYLRTRARWAEWMGRQSMRMGRRSLTLTFALFMALSFSCCVYLIISGSIALGNRYVLRPERIVSIRAPDPAPSRSVVYDTLLAQQLLNFRNYVTALQSSESGRRQLDSLLTARPGLLDSVSMAESLIINQKNTDHGKGQ